MVIKISSNKSEIIVVPVFSKNKLICFFKEFSDLELIKELVKSANSWNFKGEKLSNLFTEINSQKFLLLGISENFELEEVRRIYSNAYSILLNQKFKSSLINVPNLTEEVIKAVIEGIDLSDYNFDKYLKEKKTRNLIVNLNISNNFSQLLKETLTINSNVKFTRDIVNENAEIQTPKVFESQAKEFAKKNNLRISVLDEIKIQKQGLNLLFAVGKGSQNPPRLIILEYAGDKNSKEKLALVGKGITFDTGGLNLKPSGHMEDMKCDMGGAATVFGAFKSAVDLKLKKNLILVLSCAENSISSKAYHPGDIFTSFSGISVEIGNTDAEGRLVLADALSYVQEKFKPTQIIDMATLTGACLVALGPSLIGMTGNDSKINQSLFEASEKTFERVWEMPIYDEHRDLIKSKIADIKNTGGKYGGMITAAAFLEKFIEKKVKWSHLDIAGAAYSSKPNYYIPEFGTGRGVRLLVEYLKGN